MKLNLSNQSGQTIIETLAAIFILTLAITAGLALSIYVFANSDRVFNEIVATNLASEGVDIVRNMRDTNWLESDAKGVAWDLSNCTIGSTVFKCYPKTWEGVSGNGFHNYGINVDGSFRLDFNAVTKTWSLQSSPASYALYLQGDGTYTSNVSGTSKYARKISLSHNTASPFSTDSPSNLSELVVTSIVGWSGRGCSAMTGSPPDPATTNCNVAITERLTNWKDYK